MPARPLPQARHGPYFTLTRSEEGKTRSPPLSERGAGPASERGAGRIGPPARGGRP